MKLKVWTVTSDTDNGTETTVHAVERDAYEELKRRYVRTAAEDSHLEELIATGNFAQVIEWVSRESEKNGCDSFSVQSHMIETSEVSADPALDAAYRESATNEYTDEGRIEIDSDAVVSYGDDDGAHVAAWVWVDRSDVPLCPCGARNDDGAGYDGFCGACADNAESAGETAA